MLCRDDDTDGWWKVEEATCQAARATELWHRGQPKDWKPEPGQLVYAAMDPAKVKGAGSP